MTDINITGFNYDDFNPEEIKIVYPPEGTYTLAITGVEEAAVKQQYRMVNVHFEIASGEHRKKTFKIGYYVGNPNIEQATWAYEALGRLYFCIAQKRPTRERGIIFKDIIFKPFIGTFSVTEKNGKSYPKLSHLQSMSTAQQPQTQTDAPRQDAPWAN